MSGAAVVAALCAAGAYLAVGPPAPRVRPRAAGGEGPARSDLLQRWAVLWCGCAALGVVSFVGGPLGWLLGAGAAAGLWTLLRRSEPASVRRHRARLRRELPALVEMYGAALGSGAAPGPALDVVRLALPGPAAAELAPVAARLGLGLEPTQVWARLGVDSPPLAPLGRVMVRAHESGAGVTAAVLDLADELAAQERAGVEDRARTVGVRAAVPLGVCLLPAFLLLGIVPLVAAAVDGIRW
ncbi:type II secretion system F family protein [Nocardioides sp. ChNu-153]|uniref:type II secretion system F family protein n=1 Tax=unclassified Nocardioides TaxID=2615069 RepID=UPI00240600E0|nr:MULTISPECIES: type II secretion system F family protein [unclassified Nocardioides]MDF9715791.1 type II secretion system F family protein [Nocardioides sp. ChNu-99]MDN7121895.1 type II secretion system F family protein [Nocardioides sp. ChNu-153]